MCRWQQSVKSDSLSTGEAEEEAILRALLPSVWLNLQYSQVFFSDHGSSYASLVSFVSLELFH